MEHIALSQLTQDENDLQVLALDDSRRYNHTRPHRHGYFEFFLFTEGGGSHFIDFTAHPVTGSAVHVVFPDQIHLLKRAPAASGLILVATRSLINALGTSYHAGLLRHAFSKPCLRFGAESFASLLATLRTLQAELQHPRMLSGELARNHLAIFLSQCIRQAAETPAVPSDAPHYDQRDAETYKAFVGLLDRHFRDKKPATFYARELGLTTKSLGNSLRRVTGRTCGDLLLERTLIEAKRLLLYTDAGSKEIAFDLGFQDCSYFTRFFTRMEGKTPGAFRQYWEEKYHA